VRHILTAVVAAGLWFNAGVGYTKEDPAKTDPGSKQSGKADTWRVLWVGGYREQGVYQGVQEDRARASRQHQDDRNRRSMENFERVLREQANKDRHTKQEQERRTKEASDRRHEDEHARKVKQEQERHDREHAKQDQERAKKDKQSKDSHKEDK
jgi:hypothetical protein